MIRLDKTTRKLQIVLAGAITTNQLQCTVSFYDVAALNKDDRSLYRGATQVSTSNSTTDADICAAPTVVGTIRHIDYIAIYNLDTVSATVTVKMDDSGTETIHVKQQLLTTESLVYTDNGGWQII